jgi:hypothetical protein
VQHQGWSAIQGYEAEQRATPRVLTPGTHFDYYCDFAPGIEKNIKTIVITAPKVHKTILLSNRKSINKDIDTNELQQLINYYKYK